MSFSVSFATTGNTLTCGRARAARSARSGTDFPRFRARPCSSADVSLSLVVIEDHAALREGDGITLTRRALDAEPEQRIVLYTGLADVDLVCDGLDSGARGYTLKDG